MSPLQECATFRHAGPGERQRPARAQSFYECPAVRHIHCAERAMECGSVRYRRFGKFHGGSFAAALEAMRNHQTSLSFRAKRGIPPCLMKSRETTNKARFLALLGMTANSQSREAFCLPLSAYCLPYRRLPKRGRTVSVRYCGTNRNSLVRCAACGNSRKPPSKLLSPAKADRAPRRCRGTPRIQRERPGASGG